MNKKLTTADRLLSSGSYIAPQATVAEIFNEGVLCVSSPDSEGWGETTPDW